MISPTDFGTFAVKTHPRPEDMPLALGFDWESRSSMADDSTEAYAADIESTRAPGEEELAGTV